MTARTGHRLTVPVARLLAVGTALVFLAAIFASAAASSGRPEGAASITYIYDAPTPPSTLTLRIPTLRCSTGGPTQPRAPWAYLRVGDQVLSDHGRTLTIRAEYGYDRNLTAYNLQVDGIHTYYAGTTPVLVHNSCGPLTNAQAGDMAGRLGYRPTNFISKGQRVFTNGKNYITQDVDAHSSLWKMAGKPDGFGNRMGTYDYDLNYIGP